jgi:L-ascorbate metabolism protein UlaG (beta-lactamase superfamily)
MPATITFLGHSSFRLTLPDQRVILIDPWLADNPSCPDTLKKPPRCDMILLTHGHADHVGDVAGLIESYNPPVIANFDLCAAIGRVVGKGDFRPMNTGGTQTVDGVRIALTQAFHSSCVDAPGGPVYGGMPNGVVVRVEGLASLYHAGDTDVFSDMKLIAQLYEPKVCILPIGDHFTMGARGAALAAEFLDPAVIVPCHYGTFPILAPSPDAIIAALPEHLRPRVLVATIGTDVPWTASGLG